MQRPIAALALALLAAAVVPLPAQRAAAAAEARSLMRSASLALQAGDTLAATDAAMSATTAWPNQPAYWWSAARYALLGRRREQALDALARYTAMGGGWSLDDPGLTPLRDDPRAHALARTAGERVHGSSPFAEVADRRFHAEGVGWDPRTRRLYVGSVRRGMVMTIAANGDTLPFLPAGTPGLRSVLGVTVDTARGLLWVTTADLPEREGGVATPRRPSAVLAFALKGGVAIGRWEAPSDGASHLFGEVVLAPDGSVWATDSDHPGVYRVPAGLGSGPMERVPISHPDWVSLQGIAFGADERSAWLADWTTGLYHLDLIAGRVSPVTAEPTLVTLGIDGLYRIGPRTLLAVQNGISPTRLITLALDSAGTTATALAVLDHPPGPGEPTLGVVTPEGFLFVATSLWPFYDAAGKLPKDQPLPTAQIRRLPLP